MNIVCFSKMYPLTAHITIIYYRKNAITVVDLVLTKFLVMYSNNEKKTDVKPWFKIFKYNIF